MSRKPIEKLQQQENYLHWSLENNNNDDNGIEHRVDSMGESEGAARAQVISAGEGEGEGRGTAGDKCPPQQIDTKMRND